MGALGVADALTEPRRLEVVRQSIPIQDLPASLNGYRMAVVSDLHVPRKITPETLRGAFELANAFKPDVILIPGDLTDKKGGGDVPTFAGIFHGIEPPDGILATLGNHDHWWDAQKVRQNLREHTPVRLIEQEHIVIERKDGALAIGGVGDLWSEVVDPVKTFQGLDPKVPRVLVSHNPDVAEDRVWDTRIDLQISGHTHGGEVCWWPGQAVRVPSKYGGKFRAGLVEGRSHRVYVSRGICSPRGVRFLCRPEISYLTLTSM